MKLYGIPASQASRSLWTLVGAMDHVDVYGADHSPWVQAVLLGPHDAGVPHSLSSLPTLRTFLRSGVTMSAHPAMRVGPQVQIGTMQ